MQSLWKILLVNRFHNFFLNKIYYIPFIYVNNFSKYIFYFNFSELTTIFVTTEHNKKMTIKIIIDSHFLLIFAVSIISGNG